MEKSPCGAPVCRGSHVAAHARWDPAIWGNVGGASASANADGGAHAQDLLPPSARWLPRGGRGDRKGEELGRCVATRAWNSELGHSFSWKTCVCTCVPTIEEARWNM